MPDIDAFISRGRNAGGTELANYQLFLADLASPPSAAHDGPPTGASQGTGDPT